MSPLTQLKILQLVYKYWIRDIIIESIKQDYTLHNLLKFTDKIIGYEAEEGW